MSRYRITYEVEYEADNDAQAEAISEAMEFGIWHATGNEQITDLSSDGPIDTGDES